MRTTPLSEDEVRRASSRSTLKPGWYPARIAEAVEKPSRRGNEMIELAVTVAAPGGERVLRDWLTDSGLGAAKLRHACEAVGALDRYEAGEVGQADFPGHAVEVRIAVEKRRGFPDQNRIEDYRAAGDSPVVALRQTGR